MLVSKTNVIENIFWHRHFVSMLQKKISLQPTLWQNEVSHS
jgi:hypothetical protein